MKKLSQENAGKANFNPLHDKDLASIKRQVFLWGEIYGPKIWLYLFDITFFKLAKHQGFLYANELLTSTRKALKRSVGSHSLTWFHRRKRQAKKSELQGEAEKSQQDLVEAA